MRILLVLALLGACHPKPRPTLAARLTLGFSAVPEPPIVRVLIERDRRAIACSIPIAGAAPDDATYPPADEDADARLWVHRRDFAKSVDYQKLLSMEVEALRKCLSSMANVEEE
jgi:hypothetical protein